MHAFVIEDCDVTRTLLVHLLSQLGYEVAQATNGKEGLERLRQIPKPDIVVVDWSMPEMDGLDFIRNVRADHAYDAMPILMATSATELSHVAQALDVGANEYVMKPFTKCALLEKLALLGVDPD